MVRDQEGFLYPQANPTLCIECNLCTKVCPIINPNPTTRPINTYAVRNRSNETCAQSSSGGIFSLIAEGVLADGCVVFGAGFSDKWEVEHTSIDNLDNLHKLRSSKYVQSNTLGCFKEAKEHLSNGRKVLFTGTPCQIAGLKHYLRKDHENLIAVEVVCHGTPSPKVWQEYLAYRLAKIRLSDPQHPNPTITNIQFRDKSTGWEGYSFRFDYKAEPLAQITHTEREPYMENIYMQGFLKNLYLRPSCHHCQAREGRSGADITLGDYWGVAQHHPEIFSDLGVSVVMANTPKGERVFNAISPKCHFVLSSFDSAIATNPCIVMSVATPPRRAEFWEAYDNRGIEAIAGFCQQAKSRPFKQRLKKLWHKLSGNK